MITSSTQFETWTAKALKGEPLTQDESLAVLNTPDQALEALLNAAFSVRKTYWGKRVKLCVLQNAKSGLCREDCKYCSQSNASRVPIDLYPLMSQDALVAGAHEAVAAGSRRYCMVTSGRGALDKDIETFAQVTRTIKAQYPDLEICCCLGLMSYDQACTLKDAGVGWVNHNLNTSERFYPEICTSHTYQDRVNTVQNVSQAGLHTCSGGIVGMGETDEDIVSLAMATRDLKVDSIPINFLHPIAGTALEDRPGVTPERGLKVLCLFRFLNPKSEIRAAGGSEFNLKDKQGWALYPANSIFINGYLTTEGQSADDARDMIEAMGFEVE
jgi:biotin synthase